MNDLVVDPIKQQSISIDKKKYSIDDFLGGVDATLDKMDATQDFDIGVRLLMGMSNLSQAAGLSLAKLLHGMQWRWTEWGNEENEFFDAIKDYTNIKRITVERYINAWDAIDKIIPVEYVDRMMLRPTKDLVKLGEAWSQGYKPDDDQWDLLLQSQNSSEFANILRGVKNKKPRKSSLMLYLERNGDIIGYKGGERIFVGSLNVTESGEGLEKAIERIVTSSGIIRR